MVCEVISNMNSFSDFLVYPVTCDYYFWLKILLFIFALLVWAIYSKEEQKIGKGDFLSASAVVSIAITIIASFGTLIKNTAGIPMISTKIFLYLISLCIVLILIWIFKKR